MREREIEGENFESEKIKTWKRESFEIISWNSTLKSFFGFLKPLSMQ